MTNLHDSRQSKASVLQIQRYSRDTSSAVTNNTLSKHHPHLLLAQKLSLDRVGPPHPLSLATELSSVIGNVYSTHVVTNLHDSRQDNASELVIQRHSKQCRDTSNEATNDTPRRRHPHLGVVQNANLLTQESYLRSQRRPHPPLAIECLNAIQRLRTFSQNTGGDNTANLNLHGKFKCLRKQAEP